jgi:hypothetical protein
MQPLQPLKPSQHTMGGNYPSGKKCSFGQDVESPKTDFAQPPPVKNQKSKSRMKCLLSFWKIFDRGQTQRGRFSGGTAFVLLTL